MQTLQVGELDQPVAIADQLGPEAVQVRVPGVLVELQVARRVKRHRAHPAPVTVDPERDLLSHRSTRHQHRGLLPEQLGQPSFEGLDHGALAVTVRPRV